jgi:hypothetical protein
MKSEWAMDESEEWMWYNRWTTELLGASTLEEGGRMDESRTEEIEHQDKSECWISTEMNNKDSSRNNGPSK